MTFPRPIQSLFNKTLNNVKFGIALMLLIGAYIAIGSGIPSIRAYFELSDLQFFNAWPLKLLMLLLVATLTVVTTLRIPFTPPRYGVWLVHAGIITLILGTSFYYRNKLEGLVRIPVGGAASHFYDDTERALYARIGSQTSEPIGLPSLPRFTEYAPAHNNTAALANQVRTQPQFVTPISDGQSTQPQSLGDILNVPNINFEILEYHPYATVHRGYTQSALNSPQNTGETGVRVTLQSQPSADPHAGVPGAPPLNPAAAGASQPAAPSDELFAYLVSSDPDNRLLDLGGVELAHQVADEKFDPAALSKTLNQFHRIEAKIGPFDQTLYVQVGQTYTLADTGYSFKVESFNPAFPLSGTGEPVPILTVLVTSKAPATPQQFRRMIISANPLQTDFALNVPSAGPMGKRQKAPIDNNLVLLYTLSDDLGLLPQNGRERHTFITTSKSDLYDLIARTDGPSELKSFPTGAGSLTITLPSAAGEAPFANPASSGQPTAGTPIQIGIQRQDHLRRVDQIADVPRVQRDRDRFALGIDQVIKVRVTAGNWHEDVLVPFSRFAIDDFWDDPAASDLIRIPGATFPFSLRLGQMLHPLPATITLDRFQAVPYDGAIASGSQIMRDFRSTLTIEDLSTGEKTTGVAHLNNPVYFDGGSWLFFQAQWDPQGQRWTVLGIGNRPGVRTMLAGCAMIVLGLGYAFYLKPVIIRRMKRNALARAAGKPATKNPAADSPLPELIST